jgi:hypothetical protein
MTAKETMTPIARTASAADSAPEEMSFEDMLEDYCMARVETALSNFTNQQYQTESGWVRMPRPRKHKVLEHVRTLQATNTALQRELAELKATNAGMAKDAARYRWLRERHRNPYIQLNVPPYGTGIISGTECDEVIDAALATSAGERKGEG